MSTTYKPPAISVAYDMESDRHVLVATNYGRSAIAGPRIFRAEPWPNVIFYHDSQDAAERDAATLRSYLDDCASRKRKDTASRPTRRGWWQD
jgi:hypothetical protein